jgi:hypothetical protein
LLITSKPCKTTSQASLHAYNALSEYNTLNIIYQQTFLVLSTNFQRLIPQTNIESDIFSLIQTYGRFLGYHDHFHIVNQLTFFIRWAFNQRWSLRTNFKFDLNIILSYAIVFRSLWPFAWGILRWRPRIPTVVLPNGFLGNTSRAIWCTFWARHSTPLSCQ